MLHIIPEKLREAITILGILCQYIFYHGSVYLLISVYVSPNMK